MRETVYALGVTLSIVIITYNEEANLARTLESVMPLVRDGKGEIIVVDSGSTDRTLEIARSFGAKVFIEPWKGYAAQKNSAIEKARGDWILSLDADEEVDAGLAEEIGFLILGNPRHLVSGGVSVHQKGGVASTVHGFWIRRKNHLLGRWIKHGGLWPDPKLRLFRRGEASFEERAVHETVQVKGATASGDILGFPCRHLHTRPPRALAASAPSKNFNEGRNQNEAAGFEGRPGSHEG